MNTLEPLNHVNHLKKILEKDIGSESVNKVLETAKSILKNAPNANVLEEKKIGLLYGLIQSGKTNIINMTTALAADNGYKLFIILTDNNSDLQKQTFDRANSAFKGMIVTEIGSLEGNYNSKLIKNVLINDGIVLISKKNEHDLNKIVNFINKYKTYNIPVLIIDDEADAVGLNTNQRSVNIPPSTINQHITQIKDLLKIHLYLQVTATPQAVLLQNKDEGFFPEFIIVSEAGDGYTGIDTFFLDNKDKYVRNVDIQEIQKLLDDTTDEKKSLPNGLLQALCSFMVGASIKILEENEENDSLIFSFLCHISPFHNIHNKLKELADEFITNLYSALKNPSDKKLRDCYIKYLSDAYDNLNKTNNNMPEFSKVLDVLSDNILNYEIKIVNSESSNLKINKTFNIIIGGNKLGRGLTIPRLLTTYYGRISDRPQVDTLMQHARMCGYRSKDLNVIRIFIPEKIADLFEEIALHDLTLRELIKNHDIQNNLYLNTAIIKPTRQNVIPTTVGAYKAGSMYFPLLPEYRKGFVEDITNKINEMIVNKYKQKQLTLIEIDFMIDLINKVQIIKPRTWNTEIILNYLEWYKNKINTKGQFIYVLDSNLGYSEEKGGIGAVLAPKINKYLKKETKKMPTLIMYRISGEKWEGVEFWIPIIKFPEEGSNIIFNFKNM